MVIVPVFGADLMVVDQTVRVGAILVVGGGMEQNIQPTALTGGDRDYRDASISGRRCRSISMPRFSTVSIMFRASTTGLPSSSSCKVR